MRDINKALRKGIWNELYVKFIWRSIRQWCLQCGLSLAPGFKCFPLSQTYFKSYLTVVLKKKKKTIPWKDHHLNQKTVLGGNRDRCTRGEDIQAWWDSGTLGYEKWPWGPHCYFLNLTYVDIDNISLLVCCYQHQLIDR